ncbi:hypothetical protein [Microbacterium tenebrionis]|nr:hypothetical protein [Microbacterium ihumii]
MDYVDLAKRFVAARFPKASVAVIGGSTSRGERTSGRLRPLRHETEAA